MIKRESIGMQIIQLVLLFMLVATALVLVLYGRSQFQEAVDAEVRNARNLTLVAESIRDNVSDEWARGIYTPELLRKFAELPDPQERREKILAAVPSAVAWTVIRDKSVEGKFSLRVPRDGARNPENNPDVAEKEALNYFNTHPQANEYQVVEKDTVRYFRPVRLQTQCLLCHGDPATSKELWGRDDGKDILGYPMEGKKLGDLHGAFEIVRSLEESNAATWVAIRWFGLAALGGFLALAVLIYLGTERILVRPLSEFIQKMQNIGGGDLTSRLQAEGKTELAWLSYCFNTFVKQIQKIIADIRINGESVSNVSQQLSQIVRDTEQGARAQQFETEHVVSAMREMASAVGEVAHSAAQAADAAEDAKRKANDGQRVVEQTVAAIDALAVEIEQAARVVQELEADSDNIGGILQVIKDIADQTNLLALNAAIEAARAGEQGRGFAVVADEVRTLASRTQTSTAEIQRTIEQLQTKARSAVQVMRQSRERAQGSVTQATAAGQALRDINAMIVTITEKNAQIASASEEQSAVSEEIHRNLNNIGDVSTKTVDLAHQASSASAQMLEVATALRQSVDKFRV
ncbi:MAG TPA: methyl-accepting chemotaxis protein [Methylococcaceae bacterium]|nr:methyl-accepting chemotaxis protein [Methylococcaceae bacterium]